MTGARPTGLSTYREGSLHAALKTLYALPGRRVEERVSGYVVDVVDDDELVEIQTGSFASAARKLRELVQEHRVLLVHPIAAERLLVRVDADGAVIARRRSPKRGRGFDLFAELTAFPELVAHPNFRIELALVIEEEVRGPAPEGVRYRWRRNWQRLDRRLVEVTGIVRVDGPADLLRLLPAGLGEQFTSGDMAAGAGRSRSLGTRAAYCLERAGATRRVGKRGRQILFERAAQ